MTVYHGTSNENAQSIAINGFIAQECSDFGCAVYFSPLIEWAEAYGEAVVTARIEGEILDLSNPDHFETYKKTGNAIPNKFVGLKDNEIVAIYDHTSIKDIKIWQLK